VTTSRWEEPAHQNLIDHCRCTTRWGDGGQVRTQDGVLLFAAGPTLMNCNGAFRVCPGVPAESVISHADQFFAGLGRGYSVRVRDTAEDADLRAACEQRGLSSSRGGRPQMACASRPPEASLPAGLEIRTATTTAEISDFTTVNAEAYSTYGMPPDQVAAVFSRPDKLLDEKGAVCIVAYLRGEPVGAAQVWLSHDVAGIYWVGTITSARGRGVGAAVVRAATVAGLDRGAQVATLQTSGMAEGLYRKLGYEALYEYTTYVLLRAPRRSRARDDS
jgi:ribosomal protein S18 acetylase RimI-like enzyme